MARLLFLVLILLTLACNSSDPQEMQQEAPPPSDEMTRSFVLSEKVREAAPDMQAHLYKVLPYHSPRFIIKPEFVFMDMDREVRAQPHPHVVNMNFLHVAYWKGDRLAWSGSLLLGENRGWMGFAERGHQLKMAFSKDTYQFSFRDGDAEAKTTIVSDKAFEQWLEINSDRLYVHFYPLPKVNRNVEIPTLKKNPVKPQ